jgi:hypothetical protein
MTWGFLLGLIDSLGTVLKDGRKKNWKKKKMIFLCIFQVFAHKKGLNGHMAIEKLFFLRDKHTPNLGHS